MLFRCVAWLLLAAIAYSTLSPIELRPVTGFSADLERFVAFAAVGAAFCLGYPKRRFAIVLMVVGTGRPVGAGPAPRPRSTRALPRCPREGVRCGSRRLYGPARCERETGHRLTGNDEPDGEVLAWRKLKDFVPGRGGYASFEEGRVPHPVLEHFAAKWIRFAIDNAAQQGRELLPSKGKPL